MNRIIVLTLLLAATGLQAKEAAIQCANLIYGINQTSRCFSDEFLSTVQSDTGIATERRFRSVKLDSEELFSFPFVVMTGEGNFSLSIKERENLKRYLSSGGFLLASAGCSSAEWDQAFRRELSHFNPDAKDEKLKAVDAEHAIYHSVYDIEELKLHHSGPETNLYGLEHKGIMVCVYSPEGLNDTTHTSGCCCCGGNEIDNAMEVNINILVYALTH